MISAPSAGRCWRNPAWTPKDVKAVGASALGADCLPVDEKCRPLRKAILYGIDARATDEMAQLDRDVRGRADQKMVWPPLCSSDVMPKILWIKNKEPEVYAKAHKFLTASTFITAKLTVSTWWTGSWVWPASTRV